MKIILSILLTLCIIACNENYPGAVVKRGDSCWVITDHYIKATPGGVQWAVGNDYYRWVNVSGDYMIAWGKPGENLTQAAASIGVDMIKCNWVHK